MLRIRYLSFTTRRDLVQAHDGRAPDKIRDADQMIHSHVTRHKTELLAPHFEDMRIKRYRHFRRKIFFCTHDNRWRGAWSMSDVFTSQRSWGAPSCIPSAHALRCTCCALQIWQHRMIIVDMHQHGTMDQIRFIPVKSVDSAQDVVGA